MKNFNYKDLSVWKKSFSLCLDIYKISMKYPRAELYGLVSQLRRSAVSIPSNLAEGHSRQHTKEFINFISISLGSSAELETQIMISYELKYIDKEEYESLINKLVEIIKMLKGLLRSLREDYEEKR